MKIKCIKCGKHDSVSGGLCLDCLVSSMDLKQISTVSITTCRKCGSLQTGKTWKSKWNQSDLDDLVMKSFKSNNSKFSINKAALKKVDKVRNVAHVDFEISGPDEISLTKELDVPVVTSEISCPSCNRISGSSFEAIVQLRSYSGEITRPLDTMIHDISKFASQNSGNKVSQYIMKESLVKGGYDLYLGSKGFGEKIAARATSLYFCDIKKTKKLFGRKEGYDTYRYTFLIRLFDLSKGQHFYIGETGYFVSNVSPGSLTVAALSNGKIQHLKKSDFFRKKIKISKIQPVFEKFRVTDRTGGKVRCKSDDGIEFTIDSENEVPDYIEMLKFKDRYFYIG